MKRTLQSLLLLLCVLFSTNMAAQEKDAKTEKKVTVLYIRHGQSYWNANEKLCYLSGKLSKYRGCKDAKLTDKGWIDAIKAQNYFKDADPNEYVFYSSPLRRAFGTLVSATAKMNWAQWDTKNPDDKNEPIPLVIRPELREVGGTDTLPKTLNTWDMNGYKKSEEAAQEELINHLARYPYLDKSIKELWEKKTITELEANSKLNLQILNPFKWNEQGTIVQDGFQITDRFALNAKTVLKDWKSKSLQYKKKWFNPFDKEFDVENWQSKIEKAFKAMATKAVEGRDGQVPRTVLIGGHSQVVYGLGIIGSQSEDLSGWNILKNHKIANGAILKFEINMEGEIISDPTFPSRCPYTREPVCFEHKDDNTKQSSICTQAAKGQCPKEPKSNADETQKKEPALIVNQQPVSYSQTGETWKCGQSVLIKDDPLLYVNGEDNWIHAKKYPFVKLGHDKCRSEQKVAASKYSQASDANSRLTFFFFGLVMFLSLYVFHRKSMIKEDSEYSLLNTNGEASEI